ncbi:SDR family oxidoreductase [Streptomyces sp. AcE210]|uniref:SDR family NAD(P)-dependent oxidoreductase n=1 Tax=Streptomyces sp. AcE210 TaxID=2292703 RepID=UPI000E30A83C|nr:SDR family oxidoreductase [Streptomyces sp. AcE210]RFC75065.1 SDR family oxidoreductase [Streptomyces sp. AcE210]
MSERTQEAGPRAEYAGLVALVTGGASGIGLATARELHARGAEVAVLDLAETFEAYEASDTSETCESAGVSPADATRGPFLYVRCDVTDDDAVRVAVDTVVDRFGGLNVLVNNAGIGAQGTVEDNPAAEWHRVLDVNVVGPARVAAAALPALRKAAADGAGHAAIVNMCSIAATAGLPQRALYSASKGAVLALTRAMAADHLREGIRVTCVNPGTADTPWVGRLLASADDPGRERAALEARQPSGRLVSAAEVAHAVAYLASPRSGATTGTDLAVDGGMQGLRLRPE